jgi:predicted lipid-binding transport protein (Tim44 family)
VKQWLIRAALAALAFGAAPGVFARAGGGGHSGGGGGGHASGGGFSGGGHGGSGGGSPIGGLIALIVIGLIIWFIYRRIANNRTPGSPPASSEVTREIVGALLGAAAGGTLAGSRAGNTPVAIAELKTAIDAIRARDPNFEMETFLQRAEMTFYLTKRAISNNDTVALRPYLNDTLFAQISQMLAQRKAQHRHDLLESLNVRAVHVIHADINAQRQSLLVHFDLVYRGKTLDDSQHVLADEGQDTRHGERWTFARAAAAVTPPAGGVTASRCPACGAELRLNLDGSCTHCRASVTNGTVDWVVALVEPAPFIGHYVDGLSGTAAPTVAEGITSLKLADPNFALDAFSNRVSTGFTALQDAWCKQNLDAGRAFLSPGAYFAWRSQLETMAAEGRRNVMEQLRILRIEPMRIVHGQVFDDLTVRITASCADYEIDQNGRVVFGDRSVRPFMEEWTFQRSVGVASTGKPGTLENTCPRCGAPVQLTQIGECRFCKAAVTSGKFDWVVSRIEQEDDDAAPGSGQGGSDIGAQIVGQIGGAIVGGLLGSLLGGGSNSDDDRSS